MAKEKELEIAAAEVDDDQEENETLNEQETEEEESTEESDQQETEEEESDNNAKPKNKTQQRIDQLTAVRKTLEQELTESKEALEEAREKTKFLEDELVKAKQSYEQSVSNLWMRNGKHMYELTEAEFDEVVDICLGNGEEGIQQLKECHQLRKMGRSIQQEEAKIENAEAELWSHEWAVVSKALFEEAPKLKAHAEKLHKIIAPIFYNRKKDNEAKFTYRKLSEGGVEAKFKYVIALMKKEGIYDAIEMEDYTKSPAPGSSAGKGKKSPLTTSETKTFTRAQIEKMSLAEFAKNEKAIDKALSKGLIR